MGLAPMSRPSMDTRAPGGMEITSSEASARAGGAGVIEATASAPMPTRAHIPRPTSTIFVTPKRERMRSLEDSSSGQLSVAPPAAVHTAAAVCTVPRGGDGAGGAERTAGGQAEVAAEVHVDGDV